MAGVNTVLRIIGAVLSLVIIFFVTSIGTTLIEPIARSLGAPAIGSWSQLNMMFFAALGLIGLVIVVIVWLIAAPVREDVRQDIRRP